MRRTTPNHSKAISAAGASHVSTSRSQVDSKPRVYVTLKRDSRSAVAGSTRGATTTSRPWLSGDLSRPLSIVSLTVTSSMSPSPR